MIYAKSLRIITRVFVLLLGFSASSNAVFQEQSLPTLLLLYFDGSVQELDLNSGEYGNRSTLSLTSIGFSPTSNRLYGLHYSPAFVGFISIGEVQIVEFSPTSGIIDTIYERNNILGFSVLPGSTQMMVTYFSDAIQKPTDLRSFSPTFLCILNIADRICRDVEQLPEDQYGIVWVGSDRFLVRGTITADWYSVDLETLTPEPFSVAVEVTSSLDIGFTDEIFVTRFGSDEVFGYVDVTTGEYRPYRFTPELEFPRETVSNLAFSPDRQHLLFKNGSRHYILEMSSGSVIAKIDALQNPQWLSDDQIIARYFATLGTFPQEIVIYDIEMDTIETVASFDEEVFVFVLPEK